MNANSVWLSLLQLPARVLPGSDGNIATAELRSGGFYRRETSLVPTVLRSGEVLAIDDFRDVRTIEVQSGTIWLTETPADADIVMKAGQRFHLAHKLPVVIEALENSEIILRGPLTADSVMPRVSNRKQAAGTFAHRR